jgi:Holliday junction resolvase
MSQYMTLIKNKEETRLDIRTLYFKEKERKELYKHLLELGFNIIRMERDIEAFLESNDYEKIKFIIEEFETLYGFKWKFNETTLIMRNFKRRNIREIIREMSKKHKNKNIAIDEED